MLSVALSISDVECIVVLCNLPSCSHPQFEKKEQSLKIWLQDISGWNVHSFLQFYMDIFFTRTCLFVRCPDVTEAITP